MILSLSRTFVSKSHASVRQVKRPAGCLRANWPIMPKLKKIRQPKRRQRARCSKLFRKVRENARRNVKTARNPRANKPHPQHRSRRGTVNHSPRCVGQSLAQGTDRPSPCAKQRHHLRWYLKDIMGLEKVASLRCSFHLPPTQWR